MDPTDHDPNDPNAQPIGDPVDGEGIEEEYEPDDGDGDGEDPGPSPDFGAPFAISLDAELLPADPENDIPGCVASVKCGTCEEPFLANLLEGRPQRCPNCKTRYTHVLLWSRFEGSGEVVDAFLDHVDGDADDGEEEEPEQANGRRGLRTADTDEG